LTPPEGAQLTEPSSALQTVASGSVSEATEKFLASRSLAPEDGAFAATARLLAAKLDALASSDTAAAAHAVVKLADQLIVALDAIRGPGEPDSLDLLRQRYEARRLAQAARYRGDDVTVGG
jgi:hypothetical protein